ncbi:MAG: hypothetical protein AB4352_29815 [Hormoscilla sp.]
MTQEDPLATAITPIAEVTELAALAPQDVEEVSLEQIKSETLLRLRDSSDRPRDYPPGEAVQSAMARLVQIVSELRSPASGWPAGVPQTPENLLPYVAEEAYGVLNAFTSSQISVETAPHIDLSWAPSQSPDPPKPPLKRGASGSPPFPKGGFGGDPATTNADHTGPDLPGSLLSSQSPYILIEGLTFRLLWYVAITSYELMQLMGGIKARILSPGEQWQTGILRLAVILAAEASDINWSLDLVTSQPAKTSLKPDCLIQLPARETSETLSNFTHRLLQQIQATTPEVKIFAETARVDLLQPGKNWRQAEIKLKLDWEFIADDPFAIGDDISTRGDRTIKFADPTAIEVYSQSILTWELSTAVEMVQSIYYRRHSLGDAPHKTRSLLLKFTETAVALVNRCMENPLYLTWGREIQLDKWIPHLLWQLTGSSYDIMRLLGGVKAYILQPEWGWCLGTLRLLAVLNINPSLQLDLATGEPVKPSFFWLMSDGIIELAESGLSKEPEQVGDLLTKLLDQVQATTPTLKPFLDGTPIELLTADKNWQPGLLQLSIDLEFIPEDN